MLNGGIAYFNRTNYGNHTKICTHFAAHSCFFRKAAQSKFVKIEIIKYKKVGAYSNTNAQKTEISGNFAAKKFGKPFFMLKRREITFF